MTARGPGEVNAQEFESHLANAEYSSRKCEVVVKGSVGAQLMFMTPSATISYSDEDTWSTTGTGAYTSVLSITLSPDLTYCAITSLPTFASWSGSATATAAASADSDGVASASVTSVVQLAVE